MLMEKLRHKRGVIGRLFRPLVSILVLFPILSLLLCSAPAFAADLINENFDTAGYFPPAGWARNNVAITTNTTSPNSAPYRVTGFAGGTRYFFTPLLTNPDNLTLYLLVSNTASIFEISVGTSQVVSGDWTVVFTTGGLTSWAQNSVDLSSYNDIYVRFRRSAGANFFYIDDVVVTARETIPPCAISNLTAIAGSKAGTVLLKWTAPGDDGTGTANASAYLVKYATKYISTDDFYAPWVSTYTQSWIPAAFGAEEGTTGNRVISSLDQGTTYWFAIKTKDDLNNWSSWTSSGTVSWVNTSNSTRTLIVPPTPPAAISNLTALTGDTIQGTIKLQWTAPGGDGTSGGNASAYEVKYATKYIGTNDYYASWVSTYTQDWIPADAGTEEGTSGNRVISGLNPGAMYWFALKARDEEMDWSVWTSSGDNPSVNVLNSTTAYLNEPPSAVSNLTALSEGSGLSGEITLKWTAPGSDGTNGTASAYELKYSTKYISADDYASSWTNLYAQSWTPNAGGSEELHILTGFKERTTYYFAVKTYDGHSWSVWPGSSSVPSPYINPDSFNFTTSSAPAPVGDLSSGTGTGGGSVILSWTAPGDDGTQGDLISGSKFLVKYSSYPAKDWDAMDYSWYISTVTAAGSSNAFTVTGLIERATYYFYIKTADERPNWSPLSNKTTTWAMFTYPRGDLVIDEISWKISESGDSLVGNKRYVEIQNRSTWTVGISHYYVGTGGASDDMHWSSGVIPPGGFWVIVDGAGTDQSLGNRIYTFENNSDLGTLFDLVATDDVIVISTANTAGLGQNKDKIIDFVAYTDGTNTPVAEPIADVNAAIDAGQWDLYGTGASSCVWASNDSQPGVIITEDFIHRIQYDDIAGNLATHFTVTSYPCIGDTMEFIPPAAVSNLTALTGGNGHGGEIKLEWTAPGDDGTGGGDAAAYQLKYATRQIGADDYDASWTNLYAQSWTPVTFGTAESRILSMPIEGATYYFAIKARDGVNWAIWPGTSAIINSQNYSYTSSSAPAPVNDLLATQGDIEGKILLSWTAPGDDGTTGALVSGSRFLIRYSTKEAQVWDDMDYSFNISTAVAALTESSHVFTGLETGATYYFYIKTADERPNWSPLSNKTTAWAQVAVDGLSNGILTDGDHDWSFEQVTSKAKWTYNGGTAADYESTTTPYDREQLFKWSTLTTNWSGREIVTNNFINGVLAKSSNTASVRWRSTSGTFANARLRIVVEWYDTSYNLISKSTSTEFSLSTQDDWYQATSTFTAPVDSKKAKLRFQALFVGGDAIVYLDSAGFWTEGGDEYAPCPVSNLTALSLGTGLGSQLTLEWTAPGADGTGTANVTSYEVKYATKYISSSDFGAVWTSVYPQSWTPVTFGTKESRLLTGLDEGSTYYFAVKATEGNYWSAWPGTSSVVNSLSFNFPTSSAPAKVNNLSALTGPVGGSVKLNWTSPGDDGTTGFISGQLHIKYSATDEAWGAMPNEIFISTEVAAVTDCSYTVTGLTEGVTYYFYIKTSDEKPNWAEESNKAFAGAERTPPPAPNGLLFYDIHDWSFENSSSTAKWSYTTTNAEYGSATKQYDRNKSFKWGTLTTSWGGREIVTDNFIAGLVSNSSHTASIQWMTSSVEFTEPSARFIVEWYNSSNSLISKSTGTEFSLSSTGGWHLMTSTFTSPADTRKAKLMVQSKKITTSSSTFVYFDAAGFWAGEWDEVPPGAISNLTALSQGTNLSGDITLKWTAPGSDGTGREDLYAYEVKYATKYISTNDYDASWTSVYSQNWTPANFGSGETHILTGLAEGATYFFAVKGYDERNWGVWPGTSSAVNSL
ncbi:MAG: hypothetical protein FP827_05220, partial [Candidatus Omnitrophica bacterium]|nr:hypothetical protein [Candidatus Omnitrophota bacterium]